LNFRQKKILELKKRGSSGEARFRSETVGWSGTKSYRHSYRGGKKKKKKKKKGGGGGRKGGDLKLKRRTVRGEYQLASAGWKEN